MPETSGAERGSERALDLVVREADAITGGRGAIEGSIRARLAFEEGVVSVVGLWTGGTLSVCFGDLAETTAFESEERREELARRLNQIDGVLIPEDRIATYPSLDLAMLAPSEAFEQFRDTFEWIRSVAQQARA